MIQIDVRPYCESCCDFTPDVEHPTKLYADFEVYCQSDTIIRCKYRKRCENMVRYLQKQITKGENENV